MAMEDRYIKTGNAFTDVISNLNKLVTANSNDFSLREINSYDNMSPAGFPACCISFVDATFDPRTLGYALSARTKCSVYFINVSLYLYMESFVLGMDTFEHIQRLGSFVEMLLDELQLYGLCTDPMKINRASLIARRLSNDVALTGLVEITAPVRR
jgi:hypothetical protein